MNFTTVNLTPRIGTEIVQPYPLNSGRMMHRTTLVGEEALA